MCLLNSNWKNSKNEKNENLISLLKRGIVNLKKPKNPKKPKPNQNTRATISNKYLHNLKYHGQNQSTKNQGKDH